MSNTTPAAPVLRACAPMHELGTVAHEVYLADRWVGWVADERELGDGVRRPGRRWTAIRRETGDTAARWSADGFRTRKAALDALVAHVGG